MSSDEGEFLSNDDANDRQFRDSNPNTESAVTEEESVTDMKVLLPESIVLRLMKGKTTEKYNYAKEVKTAFNVAASTFILYLTSNAVQASQAKGRKCILPDDVFKALQAADLESFIEPLKEMQLEYKLVQKQIKMRKNLRRIQLVNDDEVAAINVIGTPV